MKVLLSNISAKNGYMIIDLFHSVLSGMNYPVMSHDASTLKFIDIDDGFQIVTLRYDFHGKKILMG
ncbi:MAG: hypothetical protein Q4E53_12320 [Eubacteriales bacterium]|nr:hypothetical protein [Eubacteriales bacterium]